MAKLVNVADLSEVGPSHVPSSSFLSIDEQIANLTRQMEKMSNLQETRHKEFIELHWSHHTSLTRHSDDLDVRLHNIESHYDLNPNGGDSLDI